MTSTFLLASIAVATALAGSIAVARTDQAVFADVHRVRDNCRMEGQHVGGDSNDARKDQKERCGERQQRASDRHRDRSNPVLQLVPNSSEPEQAAFGWQYFSDPRAAHAVVISPVGEYYLSLGNGPRQITGPAGGVWVRPPVHQ